MSGGRRRTRPSPARSANARVQAGKINRRRHLMPKCGAHAKTTGLPCQQPAMGNGRCYFHGGATPKGDGRWHRPIWPKMDTPEGIARFYKKGAELTDRNKKREREAKQRSPTQVAAYERWRATHAPTTAAHRAALREARRQAAQAIDVLKASSASPARSVDASAREAEIIDLRAQIRFWDREIEIAENWNTGVFA